MSNLTKLYFYHWTNLWRKKWLKIALFTLFSALWAFFIVSFGGYKIFGENWKRNVERVLKSDSQKSSFLTKLATPAYLEALQSYPNLCRFGMNREENKQFRQWIIIQQKEAWEKLEQAKASGDKQALTEAEDEVRSISLIKGSSPGLTAPSSWNWDFGDFFLAVEPRNKGVEFWRLMNDLGWWLLATGTVFAFLTLSVVDFLFVEPKKSGEEALLLNFTPSVQRQELLISRILVFLTYFSLFALVSAVLPMLIYYLWIGGLVSTFKFLGLVAYLLVVAPLLIFGLLLLPYILLAEWSPTLASLLPWLLFGISWGWTIFKLYTVWHLPHQIEHWFFHPAIFTGLAVSLGTLCLTIYYFRTQSRDIKG